jgi:uncharacterized protein (TIGR00369 family)
MPSGAEIMQEFIPSSPYVAHLGIRVVELSAGRAVLEVPFAERLVTIESIVHGGAIASLIDTAAMAAAWSDADVPGRLRGATVGLSVSYLAAADGVDLRAEARVLRRGSSLVHLEVDVTAASGLPSRPIAKGLVTYKLG